MLTTEQLWDDCHTPLRQFIHAHVREDEQTDDLLQDVFLKIHTHVHTIHCQERLVSWLYQIARHAISDYYRTQHGKATTSLPDDLAERLMAPEEGEENEAVQSLLPCLLPMVQQLPPPYRDALLLTEFQGLTQKELAARLGLSLSGAKSRVQRAREQLRDLLLDCCHFAFDRRGTIIAYQPKCEQCAATACGPTPEIVGRASVGLTPSSFALSRKEPPMSSPKTTTSSEEASSAITERVRERYAQAANRVLQAGEGGCCSTSTLASGCCSTASSSGSAVTSNLYTAEEIAHLPEEAVLASLGCGNPTALIDLQAGQTVLDLGSGGGIDVLLSARRVGPSGFVYGVDMTDEMLALAQENKAKAGVTNVAFLKGRIEAIPLPAQAVDVVISTCVINLAADKSQVLREAFRVLKPGGRFAVSDVVADGPVPEALRHNMEAWVGCLAGALEIETYQQMLAEAGFEDISVEITRRYTAVEASLDSDTLPAGWEAGDGKLASAIVRATKPLTVSTSSAKPAGGQQYLPVGTTTGSCCGDSCCE
jgi:RNA polymerase sigma factor (SigZ family)